MDTAVLESARKAAQSVYVDITGTVEETDHFACWRTADFSTNELIHQPHLHAGAAGIALFLADYGSALADDGALELAIKALVWADSDANHAFWSETADSPFHVSLAAGKAGLSLAWLRLFGATGDPDHLHNAAVQAEYLLAAQPAPRPGLLVGTAGCAIHLLRLFEQTGDSRWLERAQSLAAHILTDHWEGHDFTGMGQGFAGIGHLWFALADSTEDDVWLQRVHDTAERLIDCAEPDWGFINWRRKLDVAELGRCHWCHGGAGIGQFFVRAYNRTGEDRYLDTAIAAAECTWAYGDDKLNPGQCHGLAGKAELFVELFRATGERRWHVRAREFIDMTLKYHHSTADGARWQGDEPGLYSPDFICGGAGVGHFFLRVLDPGLKLPLL